FHQRLGRLLLAFGVDDLGAPLALGLGLAGNGAHHAFVQVDVLDLYVGNLDAPAIGLLVEYGLDVLIELLALGQHVVAVVLAQHGPQGGLRQLAGGVEIALDLDDGLVGRHHAEIDHRIHADGHVVARDDVLAWDVHGDHPQVDAHHLLQARYDDDQARALDGGEATQCEDDAALVFAQD